MYTFAYTFAGVCSYKGYALSDRFAALLMTRNHGTVMSLSYDALAQGERKGRGGEKEGPT